MSALSICIVLRAFVVVISMCRDSILVFWVAVHGECDVVYL